MQHGLEPESGKCEPTLERQFVRWVKEFQTEENNRVKHRCEKAKLAPEEFGVGGLEASLYAGKQKGLAGQPTMRS